MTSWYVAKIIIRLMWDVINTLDNQYLGVNSKASSIANWLNILEIKLYCTKLGIPRSYVVLSVFMLCPGFIGNYGMVKESSELREDCAWKQK